jgi:hypothetical protein
MRGWGRGIAEVWLDGVKYRTVDLYSERTEYQQISWLGRELAPGAHTLEIRVTGQKHADSTRSRVDIDAFIVLGSTAGS